MKTQTDYNLIAPTSTHILLVYIVTYPAATCFGLSLFSGSSKPNNTERIIIIIIIIIIIFI